MKKNILVFLLVVFFSVPALAWHSQWAHDNAGVLGNQQRSLIDKYHILFLRDFDIDFQVLINNNFISPKDYNKKQFQKLNIGEKSKLSSGILLIVDLAKEKLHLKTTPSLEETYPEDFISELNTELMSDFFKEKRIPDGVSATIELLFAKAKDAMEIDFPESSTEETFLKTDPKQTLTAYMKALKEQNSSPNLDIYSNSTKIMLSSRTVTKTQMKNELRTLIKCSKSKGKTIINNDYSVIRYHIKQRKCAPYFFEKHGGKWKLDLATMQKAIRFNMKNQFLLVQDFKHPYMFAFNYWDFDKNGFPIEIKLY